MKRMSIAVLLVAVLLGGCRGDAATPLAGREDLVEVLSDDFEFTPTRADCVADALIADVGEAQLSQFGVENGATRFTSEDAVAMVSAFESCADLSMVGAELMTLPIQVMHTSVTCIAERVDQDTMREFLIVSLSEPGVAEPGSVDAATVAVSTVVQECLTRDELEDLAQMAGVS
jgi:hypothetical protein